MSVSTLQVDTDALDRVGRDMRSVYLAFRNAGDDTAAVQGAIPHTGLRGVIGEFADNWATRRESLADRIDRAAAIAEVTAREFQSQDRSIARSLQTTETVHGSGNSQQVAV